MMAGCRQTPKRFCHSRELAHTRRAPFAASHSASAPRFSIRRRARPVSRFRRTRRREDPFRAQAPVGRFRGARPAQASVRLQPGTHGPRRNGVRGAKAEVSRLPDDRHLPDLRSASARSRMNITVVAAVIERDERFLVTRRPTGVHLAGLWEFPGGKIDPDESHHAALKRELRESWTRTSTSASLRLQRRMSTPIATSSCISTAARCWARRIRCWARRCGGSPAPELPCSAFRRPTRSSSSV